MPENFIILWEDFEFRHRPKDARWFQYVVGSAFVLLLLVVFLKNILFAFFIILGTAVLIFSALQYPKRITYGITQQGVVIDKTLFPFQTLESFWIREEEEEDILVLKSEKTLMPYILVPLGETDSNEVRNLLLNRLHEEPHEKTLAEVFAEYIGFH